jgi:WS/DGAT/MGAT family acyltransferase
MRTTMDDLSPTEARLLGVEDRRPLHLHTGCALVFEGDPPSIEALRERVRSRLHLVPRYRQRAVGATWCLGPGTWVDDPHFELDFHVRHALPVGDREGDGLERLFAQLLSRRLDRGKPLWELWLIEPLAPGRFALLAKTHAALVDGDANRDLLSVLLEEPDEEGGHGSAAAWTAAPEPSRAAGLLGALARRGRDVREPFGAARRLAERAREELDWHEPGLLAGAGAASPLRHQEVGLQRRYASVEVGLGRLRKERERLGGTVNDAVLTAVAGALGRYLRLHEQPTAGLVLRALVPLADATRPRVLASSVPLPVGITDPRRRHAEISRSLDGLRASGRARAAGELVALPGFAPATMLGQAARLQLGQHGFDIVVTNAPGPRARRRLLGGELRGVLPAMPLAPRQALSVSLASHRGRLYFGLLADDRALPDLAVLAGLLEESVAELRKGGAKRS